MVKNRNDAQNQEQTAEISRIQSGSVLAEFGTQMTYGMRKEFRVGIKPDKFV